MLSGEKKSNPINLNNTLKSIFQILNIRFQLKQSQDKLKTVKYTKVVFLVQCSCFFMISQPESHNFSDPEFKNTDLG